MFKKVLFYILAINLLFACGSSNETEPEETDDFDRGAMLTNLADNIIIPAFEDFSSKLSALKTAGETFTTSPSQTNLEAFRTSWYAAYVTWQQIEMFNIGKAEELQYSFYMNVYPLTVTDVEDNIANGAYDLNSVNNHDAQGFPALDYLLYGVADSDADIINKYTSDANADEYKKYITAVLNQMSSLTQEVITDWSTYRSEFISSTDNTATSSLNKLVNDYIYYYEKGLRANKFGIPAGVFSSTVLPEKVEAFYNQEISKDLSLAALNAVINFFNGTQYNGTTSGSSFSDYLVSLDNSTLSQSINSQFTVAKTQINNLDVNFYNQINSDNTQMTLAYDELQKVVVLLKVDMLQAFNISVDYVDADGD